MAMVSGQQTRSLNVETNKNLCLFIMNNEEEVMVTIYVPDTYFSIDCCFVLVSYAAMQLLVDKDTVTNAVSASHDTHLLKIDNREDELLTRINSWMSGLLKSVCDNEHASCAFTH